MKVLKSTYENGHITTEVVEGISNFGATLENVLTFDDAKVLLLRVNALLLNKDKIQLEEARVRELMQANKQPGHRSASEISTRVHIDDKIKPGALFNLRYGMCSNLGLNSIPKNITYTWAYEFNQFGKEFCFSKNVLVKSWQVEVINVETSYPVGGSIEYGKEYDTLTIWSNPRRWEFLEFLQCKLQEALELLK